MEYIGTIIEESLANKDVLADVVILSTEVEPVAPNHQTPWLTQWTLHKVEITEDQAQDIAEEISDSLDENHEWYADFKNERIHFIIFRNKIFKISRASKEEYLQAKKYGISLGIPEHQLDFSPEID